MTAKRYLRQLIDLELYLRAKRDDYEVAQAEATRVNQRLEEVKVQSSGDLTKQENLALRMVEIGMEIDQAVAVLADLRCEARELIDQLEDHRYKAVLSLRYVSGRSWGDVAEHMGYDVRHVTRLHGESLIKFDELLKRKMS